MSPDKSHLPDEEQLLQHYRQHSQGEPSAATDALILAAARQAVAPAQHSLAQRLHTWCFGAGSRVRWSVAFASVATLGVALSLTWRTQEQAPTAYDQPVPMAAEAPAPVLREMAASELKQAAELTQGEAQKKTEQRALASSSAAASVVRPVQPDMSPQAYVSKPAAPPAMADSAEAAPSDIQKQQTPVAARLGVQAVAQADFETRLREVLRLRRTGQQEQAKSLMAQLARDYPQADLDRELKRLQASEQ